MNPIVFKSSSARSVQIGILAIATIAVSQESIAKFTGDRAKVAGELDKTTQSADYAQKRSSQALTLASNGCLRLLQDGAADISLQPGQKVQRIAESRKTLGSILKPGTAVSTPIPKGTIVCTSAGAVSTVGEDSILGDVFQVTQNDLKTLKKLMNNEPTTETKKTGIDASEVKKIEESLGVSK